MAKTKETNQTEAGTHEGSTTTVPATQQIVIQSIGFTAPAPFHEGMPLTAGTASVLNQVLGENLRNNFAPKVKAAKDAAAKAHLEANPGAERNETLTHQTLRELAGAFSAYAAAYEFQGKRPTRAPLDPVGKEAHKIAKSLVLELLRKKEIDVKTLAEGKLEELITGILERKPEIKAEAERRLAATKEVATDALAGLLD